MLSFWKCTQRLYEGSIITHNQLCSSRYTVEVQIGVPAGPTAKYNIMQRSSVVKQYIRNFIFVYLVLPPSKRFISLQWKMQFDSCLFKNYVKGVILATFHADTWTPVSPSFICQRILVQDNTYWFYVLLLWGFLCHSNKGEYRKVAFLYALSKIICNKIIRCMTCMIILL